MGSIKKAVIDTNLLVRYLVEDDLQKAKAVDNLLNKAGKNEIRIYVPSIVVAELVWVLESFYKMSRIEISELLEAILSTPGIEVTEKPIIAAALKQYRTKNRDFIDTWISEFAIDRDIKTVYTFNKKHFNRIDGIEAIEP
ncbi:MAG: type II toxin-antitoxin system VapC family toxin [Planctomycetes bacterium]|nr:type II toxin-antitoxin system VapC family toxin [Planctomycetota bacterium]